MIDDEQRGIVAACAMKRLSGLKTEAQPDQLATHKVAGNEN